MKLKRLGSSKGWSREKAGEADFVAFTRDGKTVTAGHFSKPSGDDSVPYNIGCGCCSEPYCPDENTKVYYWKVIP